MTMGNWPSKTRGVCNRCGYHRTLLSLSRGYCKPCGYEWNNCIRCKVYRKIYVDGRCYGCYQDDLVSVRLNEIQVAFIRPASQYNLYLFELYLTYVRRYRMTYDHITPTLDLAQYLQDTSVHPICAWNDVYRLSSDHPLTKSPGKPVHDNGCAWMKIGYMLQELGVLGARSDEHQHRIDTLLENMDSSTAERVVAFAKLLKKSGRTDTSVNRTISALQIFSQWLSQLDPPETLTLANQASIECYLELMRVTGSYANMTVTFRRIAAFYRWAMRNRLILIDPTQNIQLSRAAEKLTICSKTQFDQLNTFLRDPTANAEQALAITLILFFGFTTADLASATVDMTSQDGDPIKIILARKPRSRGRRFYNREQVLRIPSSPEWLMRLSERFGKHWRAQLSAIGPKASFPRTPLFLDPKLQHNRNLSDEYIRGLVKSATLSATGVAILPRVLRQTCGHIMTRGNDASVLSRLGWSPQFAFHYTWLPRVRVHAKSQKNA